MVRMGGLWRIGLGTADGLQIALQPRHVVLYVVYCTMLRGHAACSIREVDASSALPRTHLPATRFPVESAVSERQPLEEILRACWLTAATKRIRLFAMEVHPQV